MLPPVLLRRHPLLALDRFAVVVLVDAVLEVLAGVRAPRLLAVLRAHNRLDGVQHQVLQLEGLHQVGVPDEAAVGQLHLVHAVVDVGHFLAALLQHGRRAEHGRVGLHRFLHLQAELGRRHGAACVTDFVQVCNGEITTILFFIFYFIIIEKRITKNLRKKLITALNGSILSPGLCSSAIVFAHARPNTTRSRREFAPRRFAPWTLLDAASPHAYKPGTILSVPFSFVITLKY